MTDLRPLPKPAPHGDILRFIYEKDGGMTGEGQGAGKTEKTGRSKTDLKREESNSKTGEENYR